ncbi:MAG: RNA-binding protein [Candidatus Thermofonsia Clade 1 bacterium]|jgi:RNA recognition motif-containing protein|uniref:RNA-binding protein n=1 Tax=Candidatus Thermofonsia Clade 1 bacterium TaxID=2364210 RepID=A0A2M8PGD8_9CHLR|nr:MAG: RNA-binding protein [Candidatus Thermofonsia Clade 1 bacterium]RMF50540.1 MAG: RNA-binding protein [Chloroflexota bacterium]
MNHKRLYVGDLPAEVTEEHLTELFAEIGNVESINLVRSARQGLHGFAFVEMSEPEAARLAAQRLNGRTLCGSRLIVYTVPPRSRPRTAPRV